MSHRASHIGAICRGFTIIELLIVTSIIPIVTMALIGLVGGLQNAHSLLAFQMDSREAAVGLMEQWRRDVELSATAEMTDQNRQFILAYRNPQSGDYRISYKIEKGALTRRTIMPDTPAAGEPDLRVPNVSKVIFEPAGRAYHLFLICEKADGARMFQWSGGAYATPLNGGAGE